MRGTYWSTLGVLGLLVIAVCAALLTLALNSRQDANPLQSTAAEHSNKGFSKATGDAANNEATARQGQSRDQGSWDYSKDKAADIAVAIFTGILTVIAWLQVRYIRINQRAYLSVEPMGVRSTTDILLIVGHVVVRNVGHLPARNLRWFWTSTLAKTVVGETSRTLAPRLQCLGSWRTYAARNQDHSQ